MAAIVLIFGSVGFAKQNPGQSILDHVYSALGLFAFGGGVNPSPSVWLEIARFLGPLVVGYAAAKAVLGLYREQFHLARLKMMRNHIVVAGMGSAGFMMAAAFERDDWPVVVIEQDPLNPTVKSCRERGIGVVIGDSRDESILRRANVGQAILLVVMCGEDGTNLDIAASARKLAHERRRGVLTALVELDDLELWGVIKAQVLLDRDGSPFRLELFNSFALAGDLMLERHPPFDLAFSGSPHVVLIGTDGVADSLVTELARRWIGTPRKVDDVLRVTIMGPRAKRDLRHIVASVSGIEEVRQLELSAWTVDPVASERIPAPSRDVSAIYISMQSETAALKAALTLRAQGGAWTRAPITIAVADERAGVGATISRGGLELDGVSAFGVLRETLCPTALLRTATEQLAANSHRCHVRARLAVGDRPDDPSLTEWDKLDASLRESNRLSADRIPQVLAQLGYRIVTEPLLDPNEPLLRFSEDEIERLAPLEHQRWQEHMRLIGYRPGAAKDTRRRRHPLLAVDFEDLPEDNKEKDRAHVRAIPEVLARAGFRVRRVVSAEAVETYEVTR